MKTISLHTLIATVLTAGMALAQGPGGGGRPPGPPPGGQGGPGGGGENREKPPVSPVEKALDQDSDGSISKEEIQGAAESLKQLDANKDGTLGEDEMKPQPPPGGQGGGPNAAGRQNDRNGHVPPLEKALDADENGVVSAEEISNAPESLKALDQNNDGKLSRMEIRAGRRFKPRKDN